MRHFVAAFTAIWLGLHMGFGYVAAPILFQHLEKMQAGNIAGILFNWCNWIGILIWAIALILCIKDNKRCYRPARRTYAITLLLTLLLINQLLITPVIIALKTQTNNWLHHFIGGSFATWHSVSSSIYLLCTILGLGLCAVMIRWDAAYQRSF